MQKMPQIAPIRPNGVTIITAMGRVQDPNTQARVKNIPVRQR